MADSSFDIEAKLDRQEVDNAINQAAREVATRFDFRDTSTEVTWEGDKAIRVESSTEDRARAALEVLRDKLVKRKVSLKGIDPQQPREVGQHRVRIDVPLRDTLSQEIAKDIIKLIKATKLKVTPANQGDKIRVTGKTRDDLQEIIRLVKAEDFDAPLTFSNYR
jgi:hypothetical protein